jgi:hypothetical protein
MYALIFTVTFVCNISHSKKNWATYDQKFVLVVMQSIRLLLFSSDVNEAWTLSTYLREIFKHKISWKPPSSGSRVVPCGRTGMHDEANSRFSQLC